MHACRARLHTPTHVHLLCCRCCCRGKTDFPGLQVCVFVWGKLCKCRALLKSITSANSSLFKSWLNSYSRINGTPHSVALCFFCFCLFFYLLPYFSWLFYCLFSLKSTQKSTAIVFSGWEIDEKKFRVRKREARIRIAAWDRTENRKHVRSGAPLLLGQNYQADKTAKAAKLELKQRRQRVRSALIKDERRLGSRSLNWPAVKVNLHTRYTPWFMVFAPGWFFRAPSGRNALHCEPECQKSHLLLVAIEIWMPSLACCEQCDHGVRKVVWPAWMVTPGELRCERVCFYFICTSPIIIYERRMKHIYTSSHLT